MPKKPLHPCNAPGCGALTRSVRCDAHARAPRPRTPDTNRPNARQRGYSYQWEKARMEYLQRHPLCVHHLARGYTVPAKVVDHIVDHKGDHELFWDRDNWQALCTTCHNKKTARTPRNAPPAPRG